MAKNKAKPGDSSGKHHVRVLGSDKTAGAQPRNKGGRPTVFRAEYIVTAREMARCGLTDVQMAKALQVTARTFDRWKLRYPEFRAALELAKEVADAEVVKSLYRNSLGYVIRQQKAVVDRDGIEHVIDYEETVPANTIAQIFWLKNRLPDEFADRHEFSLQIATPTDLASARERLEAQQRAQIEEQAAAAATLEVWKRVRDAALALPRLTFTPDR